MTEGFTPDEIGAQFAAIKYAGKLDRGEGPRVAIIGARASSEYGNHMASDLASDCARQGLCVVAQFAFGISQAALRGALAVDGKAVGVAVQSLDRYYPSALADLQRHVMTEALAVSVFPDFETPTRTRFLMTARILAHLSDAVVIVEAGVRSAALSTADEAHRLGKPVYAVPGPVTSAVSAGPHQLIANGKAQILTSAADLRIS